MAVPAEEVFRKSMTAEQRARAARRGDELISECVTLQQLRKARELTQIQLGRALGKDQVSVSQIEKRTDMLLSTLRGYVEAMGGRLDLVVAFDGHAPVTLTALGSEEPEPSRRKPR
jgi:transcriptional regulator with XRE-family HTH domain